MTKPKRKVRDKVVQVPEEPAAELKKQAQHQEQECKRQEEENRAKLEDIQAHLPDESLLSVGPSALPERSSHDSYQIQLYQKIQAPNDIVDELLMPAEEYFMQSENESKGNGERKHNIEEDFILLKKYVEPHLEKLKTLLIKQRRFLQSAQTVSNFHQIRSPEYCKRIYTDCKNIIIEQSAVLQNHMRVKMGLIESILDGSIGKNRIIDLIRNLKTREQKQESDNPPVKVTLDSQQ